MLKKATKILLVVLFLVSSAPVAFADGQPPAPSGKSGNFSKKSFSNKNAWSNNGKAIIPPDPTNAGGGYNAPIPFSSGMVILAFGSILYFVIRTREENNKIQKDIENI